MKQSFVAVILLNWNGLTDTIECVESLLRSSWQKLTIYIVDNGSKNKEARVLAEKFPEKNFLQDVSNRLL